MSVKKSVLSMLESHRGEDISGEALANMLGVSRAAVWKAINSLKEQGYPITAATNRGYRLSDEADILSAEGIAPYLDSEISDTPVCVFGEIDSTNLEAKRRAVNGGESGTVIIADTQTLGRGRFGRSFFSPSGCGIYMSLLLKPSKEQLSDATLLTTAAAVAVCRAIGSLVDVRPQIKWVNDVYIGGKKICGILTEAVSDIESGAIESIVVGIGINFKDSGEPLPEELAPIVGTLFQKGRTPVSRNRLAAQLINELFAMLPSLSTRAFLNDYRSRCLLLGQEIVFVRQDKKYAAVAESIDDDGGLVVRLKNGELMTLRSGEVSVRPRSLEANLPFSAGRG